MDLDKNKSLDDEEDLFKDYKPTGNDPLTLPKHVIYLLLAVSVTGVTLFAMIRHLIKDLIHDLAGMWQMSTVPFHLKNYEILFECYLASFQWDAWLCVP